MLDAPEIRSARNHGWLMSDEAGAIRLVATTRDWVNVLWCGALFVFSAISFAQWLRDSPTLDYFSVGGFLLIFGGCIAFAMLIAMSAAGHVVTRITPERIEFFTGIGRVGWRWTEARSDVTRTWWETRRGRGGAYEVWFVQGRRRHRLSGFLSGYQSGWLVDLIRKSCPNAIDSAKSAPPTRATESPPAPTPAAN